MKRCDSLCGGKQWRNGVKQVLFDANQTTKFAAMYFQFESNVLNLRVNWRDKINNIHERFSFTFECCQWRAQTEIWVISKSGVRAWECETDQVENLKGHWVISKAQHFFRERGWENGSGTHCKETHFASIWLETWPVSDKLASHRATLSM